RSTELGVVFFHLRITPTRVSLSGCSGEMQSFSSPGCIFPAMMTLRREPPSAERHVGEDFRIRAHHFVNYEIRPLVGYVARAASGSARMGGVGAPPKK